MKKKKTKEQQTNFNNNEENYKITDIKKKDVDKETNTKATQACK